MEIRRMYVHHNWAVCVKDPVTWIRKAPFKGSLRARVLDLDYKKHLLFIKWWTMPYMVWWFDEEFLSSKVGQIEAEGMLEAIRMGQSEAFVWPLDFFGNAGFNIGCVEFTWRDYELARQFIGRMRHHWFLANEHNTGRRTE